MPMSLYQRLLMAAERQGKTLSDIATDLIDRALTAQEETQWERIYEGLGRLKGSGPTGIVDASTTINQTVYALQREDGE
jgi:hypothetical protein